jgi:ribosome-associated heat shock protein Hsp15
MTATEPASTVRIDRWLWYCRAFRTRTIAAEFVSKGKVRVNRQKISKPGTAIRVGDVLTFVRSRDVSIYKVLDLGCRRGPAVEAQLLYENLAEPEQTEQTEKTEE